MKTILTLALVVGVGYVAYKGYTIYQQGGKYLI